MIRRWLIRSLALTLLTLCLAAGVGSYLRAMSIERWGERVWGLQVQCGRLLLYDVAAGTSPGWSLHLYAFPVDLRDDYLAFPCHFAGFALNSDSSDHAAFIPLWFPTLLAAFLVWLVWRKTRSKYNAKGFPVEPTAPTKEVQSPP